MKSLRYIYKETTNQQELRIKTYKKRKEKKRKEKKRKKKSREKHQP